MKKTINKIALLENKGGAGYVVEGVGKYSYILLIKECS